MPPTDDTLHYGGNLDPFQVNDMGDQPSIRRLFIVHYSCPFCFQEHRAELYLTLKAAPYAELLDKAQQILNSDTVKLSTFLPSAIDIHARQGDMARLRQNYPERPLLPHAHHLRRYDRRGKLHLRSLQPEV